MSADIGLASTRAASPPPNRRAMTLRVNDQVIASS